MKIGYRTSSRRDSIDEIDRSFENGDNQIIKSDDKNKEKFIKKRVSIRILIRF